MTDLRNQRRMASQVLGVGESRVWIDPLHAEDAAAAVTRADIRGLVEKGYIAKSKRPEKSHGRARMMAEAKATGRRKGQGSREGATGGRNPSKKRWIRTIRPLRQTLAMLRAEGVLQPAAYRLYYRRAKGGVFRSRAHLLSHLVTDGLLTEDKAKDFRVRAEAARAATFGRTPGRSKPGPGRAPLAKPLEAGGER